MRPIERLALFLKENKIRFSMAEKEAGIANGYLGKQIRNQASVGSDILEKICLAYPNLNPVWLLTGKGIRQYSEQSAPGEIQHETDSDVFNLNQSQAEFAFSKQFELCQLQIESLKAQMDFLKKELKLQNDMIIMLQKKGNG